MIEMQGLRRVYGRGAAAVPALRGVDLEIKDGEFVAIVGTSGSGKTTLLNAIGCLDTSYEGTLKIAGKEVGKLNDSELAATRNEHLGFVFQQFNLLDHLTSLENVLLPSFFGYEDASEPAARAAELLTRFGLADKLDVPPNKLSGGQKQRVAIARALLNRPSILLCDEPTGSLDRKTGVEILDTFRHLCDDEGLTIIVVTHERHIAGMADRIIVLESGAIASDERVDPSVPDMALIGEDDGGEPFGEDDGGEP